MCRGITTKRKSRLGESFFFPSLLLDDPTRNEGFIGIVEIHITHLFYIKPSCFDYRTNKMQAAIHLALNHQIRLMDRCLNYWRTTNRMGKYFNLRDRFLLERKRKRTPCLLRHDSRHKIFSTQQDGHPRKQAPSYVSNTL